MNKPLPATATQAAVPAERKPLPPMVQFKHELERIAAELPSSNDIPVEKMKSAIIVAVQKQPDLLKADRATLWQSARSCAADGLLPDGREAAFVLYGNNVQYLPMIGGIYKRMRNSGQVKFIRAEIVHENDAFRVWIDERTGERRFSHDYNVFAPATERGKPLGAYAVAGLSDGTIEFEPMGAADIDRVRRVSRSQKGDNPTGVWAQWWDQMWKKAVIRRLSKRLPVSSEDVRFLDRGDDGQIIDEQAIADAPPAPVVERRSKHVSYVEDDEPEADAVDVPAHDPDTGEVEDAEVVETDEATRGVVERIVSDFADCSNAGEVESVMDLWRDQVEQIGAAWPAGKKAILEAADAARERVA
jgi:recombination protein RecT